MRTRFYVSSIRTVSFTLLALSLARVASAAEPAQPWEQIIEEKGITVWKREVPGSSFVEFRARARVEAPIIQIAAVLRNSGRAEEWMESCSESRVVAWLSPVEAIVYNRTKSPGFFVSDRDLVAHAKAKVLPDQRKVIIDFWSVQDPRVPEIDGAVRMRSVRGHWSLKQIDRATTEVEYQISADPGGQIPSWLVNWASRRLPFDTIDKLRIQAKKPGYDNDVMILERAIDWSGFEEERRASL